MSEVDVIVLKAHTMATLTLEETESGNVFRLVEQVEGYPEMEFQSVVRKRQVQRGNS
jgi:hypothetical protein